jgi:hypothetical protein
LLVRPLDVTVVLGDVAAHHPEQLVVVDGSQPMPARAIMAPLTVPSD